MVRSARIGTAVCMLAGIGLLAAVAVIGVTVVRGRITPGLGWLLIPAIPLVVLGQLWTIAIFSSRRAGGRRPWPRTPRQSREFMFAGLPSRWFKTVSAVGLLAWISGASSFYWLAAGGPASSAPGCPYRLESHGSYSCVTRSRWLLTGAAEQRLAASVFAFFFVVHLGVSAGQLRLRRETREVV